MNPLPVVFSQLRQSSLNVMALILLIGFSVGIGVCLSLLEPAIRQGVGAAANRFDLVAGAPGSEAQLVLSTVYLDQSPLSLMNLEIVEQLDQDPGVAWYSPLLFGDTWQGYPVVGVSSAFLEKQGSFESNTTAYVGALVPLNPGDTLQTSHGHEAMAQENSHYHHHHTRYSVEGRLAPTGTPWDRAILVSAHSVWHEHGLEQHDQAMPAVVIKPAGVADAYRLRASLREKYTAVFPAEVLVRVFGLMGDVQQIVSAITLVALAAVVIGVLMAILAGMPRRLKEVALLRALGAPRMYGALVVWLEVASILLLGCCLGLGMGRLAAGLAAGSLGEITGVAFHIHMGQEQLMVCTVVFMLGGILALIPALYSYRGTVERLFRG